ncbi:MAG: arginase [Patescibacteria group bacterium]
MTNMLSMYRRQPRHGKVTVLGVPVDVGKAGKGCARAPQSLREHGLVARLEAAGFAVEDAGDVEVPTEAGSTMRDEDSHLKHGAEIAAMARRAAKKVEDTILDDRQILCLGGDHAMSIGTIAGASAALKGDLGVIWIDAHSDIHTHETTTSGNVHGMPAAAMMGIGHPSLTQLIEGGAKVHPKNVVFVGLKDMDAAEVETIERLGVTAITMMDIAADGLRPVFKAIDDLRSRVGNIWVSQDVDAIDGNDAPGTCMATPGGLTYREVTSIARYVGTTCPVVGLDIAELVPRLDMNNKTTDLVFELIAAYFGAEESWYTRYMDEFGGV